MQKKHTALAVVSITISVMLVVVQVSFIADVTVVNNPKLKHGETCAKRMMPTVHSNQVKQLTIGRFCVAILVAQRCLTGASVVKTCH